MLRIRRNESVGFGAGPTRPRKGLRLRPGADRRNVISCQRNGAGPQSGSVQIHAQESLQM